MKRLVENRLLFTAMGFFSLLISFAILNRWAVTDLKEKSFGRIWQYYVSWADVGFFRRGFVGTFLNETGVNQIFPNEYLFAYVFYGALLVILYALAFLMIKKVELKADGSLIAFIVLFSPAIFSHFAYSTGSNDLLLFIFFVVAAFFCTKSWVFCVFLGMGVLTHELFVFMLPAAILLRYSQVKKLDEKFVFDFLAVSLISLFFIAVVLVAGKPAVLMESFNQIMAKRMPNAAYQHSLWSGYSEIFGIEYSVEKHGIDLKAFLSNIWWLIMPTIYSVMAAFGAAQTLEGNKLLKALAFLSFLFPLAAQFVAGDYYRWVSISAGMSVFAILHAYSEGKAAINKGVLIVLAVFAILLPFGGADLERPFPMHQLILEKIG